MTESKPTRTIAMIRPINADGVGVFRISLGSMTWLYALREIPCFIGGRGFVVHRLGLGVPYHVRVGVPRDCSCECLGFLYRNRCRHILGLLALIRTGKLK
jgi:hypothetical protein